MKSNWITGVKVEVKKLNYRYLECTQTLFKELSILSIFLLPFIFTQWSTGMIKCNR